MFHVKHLPWIFWILFSEDNYDIGFMNSNYNIVIMYSNYNDTRVIRSCMIWLYASTLLWNLQKHEKIADFGEFLTFLEFWEHMVRRNLCIMRLKIPFDPYIIYNRMLVYNFGNRKTWEESYWGELSCLQNLRKIRCIEG